MDAKTRIRNAVAKARSNAERRRLQADLDERLRAEGIDPATCVAEVLTKVARGTLRRGDSVIAIDDIHAYTVMGSSIPKGATGVVCDVNHADVDNDNPGLGEASVAWDGIADAEPVSMDYLALDPGVPRPEAAARAEGLAFAARIALAHLRETVRRSESVHLSFGHQALMRLGFNEDQAVNALRAMAGEHGVALREEVDCPECGMTGLDGRETVQCDGCGHEFACDFDDCTPRVTISISENVMPLAHALMARLEALGPQAIEYVRKRTARYGTGDGPEYRDGYDAACRGMVSSLVGQRTGEARTEWVRGYSDGIRDVLLGEDR